MAHSPSGFSLPSIPSSSLSSNVATPERSKAPPAMAVLRAAMPTTTQPDLTYRDPSPTIDSNSSDGGPRGGAGGVRGGDAKQRVKTERRQHGSTASASTGLSGAGGAVDAGGGMRQGSRGFSLAAKSIPPLPLGNLPQGWRPDGTTTLVASTGFSGAGVEVVAANPLASQGFSPAGGGAAAPIPVADVGEPCAGGGTSCQSNS